MAIISDDVNRYFERDGKMYYRDQHGNVLEVRDQGIHQQQRQEDSHLKHFQESPKAKHRRSAAIQERFNQLVSERVDPGFHPDVKRIKDNEYMVMRQDPAFKPLNTYIHKLQLKSGKWVRPVLKGEVGMIGATIYILEEGEAAGQIFQVGADLKKEDSNG